ncbi:MAG TPA: FAD-dependent oxidoreductase [Thermoanaerobaculia bacterium]|nr:FAD-dependent oxidoreductase [Thermoanaerobaculia bacterium]
MSSADVIVVGAGAIGCSIADHTASRGVRVLVVDRAPDSTHGGTARSELDAETARRPDR